MVRVSSISTCLRSRSFAHQTVIPHQDVLTLLHKTSSFLPRALLPKSHTTRTATSLEFWNDILSGTYNDLTSTNRKPARIAVYGINEWSGAYDLVTALLEEPLVSDTTQNKKIRDRWKNTTQQPLTIKSCDSCSTSETSVFQTSSAYLSQFSIPLEITEIPPGGSSPESLISDETVYRTLLKSDVAIIVCNPVTTPLSLLFRDRLLAPKTVFVLTCTSNSESLQTFLLRFVPDPTSFNHSIQGPKILFVDPARAVAANEALKSDIRSSAIVQRYQDHFIDSQVSTITSTLREQFLPNPTSPEASSIHIQTSLAQIRAALSACYTSLIRVKNEVDEASLAVSRLNSKIEEMRAKAYSDILGRSGIESLSQPSTEGDVVVDALKEAEKQVKVVMDHLTWWRMVWRVDDISLIVSQIVEQAWCRDLERQLILQTGRLSALQSDMAGSIFALLKTHSHPPFNSAILLNSLRQLAASPLYATKSWTLTGPIDARRAQIIKYPTAQLHVAGQQAVLGMSGGIITSAGISWAGWLGWLTSSSEGLLNVVGLEAGTAMGMGLLGVVIAIRWGVGKWERSKRRWWADWNRVGEGLGRDLRTTLDQTMREKVLGVAEFGCNRLSELISERRKDIEDIEEEFHTLTQALEALEQRSR